MKRQRREAEAATLALVAREDEDKRRTLRELDQQSIAFLEELKSVDPNSKVEPNLAAFDCPICMANYPPGKGRHVMRGSRVSFTRLIYFFESFCL
jgi:hypothetical protein